MDILSFVTLYLDSTDIFNGQETITRDKDNHTRCNWVYLVLFACYLGVICIVLLTIVFPSLSFGHCILCLSAKYGLLLPLWYLHTCSLFFYLIGMHVYLWVFFNLHGLFASVCIQSELCTLRLYQRSCRKSSFDKNNNNPMIGLC